MTLPPSGLMSPTNPHLSWSQLDVWRRSPTEYARRYFAGERFEPTAPMRFGKDIATLIERNDPSVRFVPRLKYPEHKIETVIAGVPTLSFLDSFDNTPPALLEYKTGATMWTAEKVAKHDQLLFYCAAIRAAYNILPKVVHLVWLRTQVVSAVPDERGVVWDEVDGGVISLTGEAVIFPRTIFEDEVNLFEEEIVRVAGEIESAWGVYQNDVYQGIHRKIKNPRR